MDRSNQPSLPGSRRFVAGLERAVRAGRMTPLFLAAGLTAAGYQLTATDGTMRAVVAFAIFLSSVAALAVGIRTHRPSHPVPWWTLLVTLGFSSASVGGWIIVLELPAAAVGYRIMDGSKLAGTLALVVTIAGFIQVHRTQGRRDALLDATLIAGAGALMLWQWYVLIARREGPELQPAELLPILLVGLGLTVALTLYRLAGGAPITGAGRLLIAAAASTVIAQGALAITDTGAGPARWTDTAWILPAIFVGTAGLHPSMGALTEPRRIRQGLAPRLVIAGISLFANPLLVLVQLLDRTPSRTAVILVCAAMAIVGLIGLWRVGRIVVQLDDVRSALARSERRFRSLVQRASEVVAVVETDGRFTYVSPATRPLLGLPAADLVDTALAHLITPADRDVFERFWAEICNAPAGEAMTVEVGILSGKEAPLRADIVAINLEDDPDIRGIAVTIRDVTVRAAFEARLRHLATHDSLTGLANRELFQDRVDTALTRSRRSGRQICVVFIDLDDFKTINDSLGHFAGDELLRMVAERLAHSLRSADTAARLGGDEFAVLLEGVENEADARMVVSRIQQSLRRPLVLEGRSILVGATMGVAMGGGDSTPADLLRNADTAMFNAKNAGKDRTHLFAPEMHDAARSRFDLKADLHDALDLGQFELYYQPIYRLSDRSIQGFEALLRWNHPQRGLVMPGEFIPLIEETGQIIPVGRWVLSRAISQTAAWRQQFPHLGPFSMGINLSVRQFQQADLISDLTQGLAQGPLEPRDVVIEITESVFIGDTDRAVARLSELKQLGIRLAIDDFGTGYSALSYLQRFQTDIVKVDKAFVAPLGTGSTPGRLTHGILELIRGLDIATIAEGVERPDQVIDLLAMDCDLAQGFHLAGPQPADRIEQLLAGAKPSTGSTIELRRAQTG